VGTARLDARRHAAADQGPYSVLVHRLNSLRRATLPLYSSSPSLSLRLTSQMVPGPWVLNVSAPSTDLAPPPPSPFIILSTRPFLLSPTGTLPKSADVALHADCHRYACSPEKGGGQGEGVGGHCALGQAVQVCRSQGAPCTSLAQPQSKQAQGGSIVTIQRGVTIRCAQQVARLSRCAVTGSALHQPGTAT